MRRRFDVPDLGVGVGLRIPHHEAVLSGRGLADFFEIVAENFLVPGGMPRRTLRRVLELRPVIPHGVSLSVGGTDPLCAEHLGGLRDLVRETRAPWASDHLCFSGAGGLHLHELFPLPMTEEVALHVAARVRAAQDMLEVPFALENVSSYLRFSDDRLEEWEFLSMVAEEADCAILLDVNNVVVSAKNHGFDPTAFVDGVPAERIVQVHLAGHADLGTHLFDTHDAAPIPEVLELYRRTLARTGPVSTLLEWDDRIPSLEGLLEEAARIRRVRDEALAVLGGAAP